MNKAKTIGLILLTGGVLNSAGLDASTLESTQKKEVAEPALLDLLNTKVSETIKHSQSIPGLKSELFSVLRNKISSTWETLSKDGVLEVSGTDEYVRPLFVSLQAVVEHVLASEMQKDVKLLKGIIHTPMPATPLCTEEGEVSKELVDPSIEKDPSRLFTVQARTTIVRDYLRKGGELHIVYPKDGYNSRTEEQQKIYQAELDKYPNLHNVPLDSEIIPTDLIGATYIFQDKLGKKFVFAIKMTQAKNPQETGRFGLWYGPAEHPAIQKRLQALSNYFQENNQNKLI